MESAKGERWRPDGYVQLAKKTVEWLPSAANGGLASRGEMPFQVTDKSHSARDLQRKVTRRDSRCHFWRLSRVISLIIIH